MGSSREMWQVGRTGSGPVMGQWESFMITAVSYKLTVKSEKVHKTVKGERSKSCGERLKDWVYLRKFLCY